MRGKDKEIRDITKEIKWGLRLGPRFKASYWLISRESFSPLMANMLEGLTLVF